MLALIFIYFVGKNFYELAHEHNRSRWGFAVLSVIVFYASQLIFGTILVSSIVLSGVEMTTVMQFLMNVLAIGCGVAGIWLFYFLLKRAWGKNPKKGTSKSDLLDDM